MHFNVCVCLCIYICMHVCACDRVCVCELVMYFNYICANVIRLLLHLINRPNSQCYLNMMSRIVAFLGHYVKGITWKISMNSVYLLSFCGRNGEGYFCVCSTDVISGDNRVRSMNSIVRCLFMVLTHFLLISLHKEIYFREFSLYTSHTQEESWL